MGETYAVKLADFQKVNAVREEHGLRLMELSDWNVQEITVCHTGPDNCASLWLHVSSREDIVFAKLAFGLHPFGDPALAALRRVPKNYYVNPALKAA